MDDVQGTTRPRDPSPHTVRFGTDGHAGSLRFGLLAGTRAMCAPPSMDEKLLRDPGHVRGLLVRDGQWHLSLMADGAIHAWRPAGSH